MIIAKIDEKEDILELECNGMGSTLMTELMNLNYVMIKTIANKSGDDFNDVLATFGRTMEAIAKSGAAHSEGKRFPGGRFA